MAINVDVTPENTQIINRLSQQAITMLGGAYEPNVQNLMQLAVALAQDVNKFPTLKGQERLAIVIGTLREILAAPAIAEKMSEDVRVTLNKAITTIIPELITMMVDASRGRIELQRPSTSQFCLWFCRSAAVVAETMGVGRLITEFVAKQKLFAFPADPIEVAPKSDA